MRNGTRNWEIITVICTTFEVLLCCDCSAHNKNMISKNISAKDKWKQNLKWNNTEPNQQILLKLSLIELIGSGNDDKKRKKP